jgi:hypothetical protein
MKTIEQLLREMPHDMATIVDVEVHSPKCNRCQLQPIADALAAEVARLRNLAIEIDEIADGLYTTNALRGLQLKTSNRKLKECADAISRITGVPNGH